MLKFNSLLLSHYLCDSTSLMLILFSEEEPGKTIIL